MTDWSPPLGEAQLNLKAAELILTNYPPAQPLDRATQDELVGHLQAAMVAIDQCGAWVRAHGAPLSFCEDCNTQGACNVNNACRRANNKGE